MSTSAASREAADLGQRYAERDAARHLAGDRDSLLNAAAAAMWTERVLALQRMLQHAGFDRDRLRQAAVLELGCGAGGNLADLIRLGASPSRCVGVDLLPERIALAAELLPSAVTLVVGDGLLEPLEARGGPVPASSERRASGSHDLVLLFTVLSSVLDPQVRQQLLASCWQRVAPGGALLIYDFVVDNPRNPGVRRLLMQEVRAVCSTARHARVERVTLAPPLARAACQLHPALYRCLNALPWLRTHRLACFTK